MRAIGVCNFLPEHLERLIAEHGIVEANYARVGQLKCAHKPATLAATVADMEWMRREMGDTSVSVLSREAVAAEFPRGDARFAGLDRRYSIHLTNEQPDRPLFQAVALRDWKADRDQVFTFGPRHLVEEMVFAPRPGSSEELDGWLIGTTLNLDARATELHVFDARHVRQGPVVSWRAPVALPVTFHGVFV